MHAMKGKRNLAMLTFPPALLYGDSQGVVDVKLKMNLNVFMTEFYITRPAYNVFHYFVSLCSGEYRNKASHTH